MLVHQYLFAVDSVLCHILQGRLAMIGIAGFVAQELVNGQEIFGKGITSDVPQVIINKS